MFLPRPRLVQGNGKNKDVVVWEARKDFHNGLCDVYKCGKGVVEGMPQSDPSRFGKDGKKSWEECRMKFYARQGKNKHILAKKKKKCPFSV